MKLPPCALPHSNPHSTARPVKHGSATQARRRRAPSRVLAATGAILCLAPAWAAAVPPPVYDHVVVAIMENHGYDQIIGSMSAPYINWLATQGALFTNSKAVEHPSQPNYLDLYSGSNQGITDDSCPHDFTATPNLGGQLVGALLSFAGYSENLPTANPTACSADSSLYARKHNPWVDFDDVPAGSNLAFADFPSDFTTLPTLSFVIPNQCHDMHGTSACTGNVILAGDTWVHDNLDAYVQWAQTHNSLFVLTFDEDDFTATNRIVTIFAGAMVIPGQYAEAINHYTVLATLEYIYGLPAVAGAMNETPIADVWDTTLFKDGFDDSPAPAVAQTSNATR